jgi:hypothetical protein
LFSDDRNSLLSSRKILIWVISLWSKDLQYVICNLQTSRILPRSCQSFGLIDMNILSDRKIFCRSEKKVPKNSVTCIMFSLAFLEWFTLVLAIGHLISPLVLIEVKVIQFSVFNVVQYCICYVFYSVCLKFCCFDDLVLLVNGCMKDVMSLANIYTNNQSCRDRLHKWVWLKPEMY